MYFVSQCLLDLIIPSINSCLVILPSPSESIWRKKSMTLDFLLCIHFMYRERHFSNENDSMLAIYISTRDHKPICHVSVIVDDVTCCDTSRAFCSFCCRSSTLSQTLCHLLWSLEPGTSSSFSKSI